MTLPRISTTEDMLDMLRRHSPAMVETFFADLDMHTRIFAADPKTGKRAKTLAYVDESGSAFTLLMNAMDVDRPEMAEAWSALPIRYGPYCSHWVLADSPFAKARPGEA